jgi:NhaP-type Na+/H+ or K+/H+ antiporter
MALFKMPFDVAFFFGYTLASVGPAMVINIMAKLTNNDRGVKIGLT